MRCKLLSAVLAGGLTVATGAAMADENRLLTDAQLDGVNAGATAIAAGVSQAAGDLLAETLSKSAAAAQAGLFATAQNSETALAVSTFFGAAAASQSQSAASLP